jgi:hypothetical protein
MLMKSSFNGMLSRWAQASRLWPGLSATWVAQGLRHAKEHDGAKRFYERFGFTAVDAGSLTLYLPLDTALRSLPAARQ